MINTQELSISNKSYINKDFQKLYPEILDLAKKLSAKWDPSTSNESDPGVVLLKVLGFTGDMLNYNIDKNILETTMPSATQENSMRNLCEMNGYFPKYYQSATTTVSLMYTGTKLTDPATMSFTLKALETTLTDVDGSITYTLITDWVINDRYKTAVATAIEGKLETLIVNNVEEIHLTNLDDNNRLYFPETQVAENGIFIKSVSDTSYYWDKVDNLNTTEPGQFVYKFGYDSVKRLPYLEFPKDISSLIEDGITVQYIRTSGSSGNIKAGTLTVLSSPAEVAVTNRPTVIIYPDTNEDESQKNIFIIDNNAEANNGSDPESIEEAYNSFKKTVGTFDTLVTCRDYANAIYNLQTSDSKDVVSNVQVTDRRTDINFSNQILSFNEYGTEKLNVTDNAVITPFDLCIYALNPIVTSYTDKTYANSFKPLNDLTDVVSGVEEYKNISHNYKDLNDSDTYLYKNYYTLNAKITTNYKVNTFEQDEILKNINSALYKAFNAREVDYGHEIPFDILLETIQAADTRIKNVSLDEPVLKTVVMTKDGTETDLLSGSMAQYLNLVAKNILAGRAPLFDYNADFDFEFGQAAVVLNDEAPGTGSDFIHENLVSVTTEVTILNEEVTSANGYTLRSNEYVQAIAPSLVTELIYPAYVNYRWFGNKNITANEEHTIVGDESLVVNYTDSNDVSIAVEYTHNQIITYRISKTKVDGTDYYESLSSVPVTVDEGSNIFKPNFIVKTPTETSKTTKKIDFGVGALAFYSLGTSETLEKRKQVKTILTSKSLPCYWIMTNKDNALFSGSYDSEIGGYETILGENEYFMYSNPSLTELEVLGSGTKLTLKCTDTSGGELTKWKLQPADGEETIQIANVSQYGLAAFEKYNWRYKNFDATTYNLTLEEMSILTLTKDDVVRIYQKDSESSEGFASSLTNTWVTIPDGWVLSYTIDGTEEELPTYNNSISWKVRSRLDLNAGPDLKQEILTGQTISMTLAETPTNIVRLFDGTAHDGSYIMFNTLIQHAGGVNLDMEVTYLDGTTGYDVNAYTFTFVEPTYTVDTEDGTSEIVIERGSSGYCQIGLKDLTVTGSAGEALIDLPIVSYYDSSTRVAGSGKTELLMIYWNHDIDTSGTIVDVEATAEGGKGIRFYNSTEAGWLTSMSLVPGINIVEINSTSKLTLVVYGPGSGTDDLQLGRISVTSGYNSALNLTALSLSADDLLALISTADVDRKFFYNGTLDSYSLIEYNDLSDPRALFDYNNLANRFTLDQIDFVNSKIEIVRTSKI